MDALGRMTALRLYLDAKAQQDFHVAHQIDPFTVIIRERRPEPRRPNHILHLLLTMFTCGLWAVFWILLTISWSTGRRRHELDPWFPKAFRIHVDENGTVNAWDDNAYRSWEAGRGTPSG